MGWKRRKIMQKIQIKWVFCIAKKNLFNIILTKTEISLFFPTTVSVEDKTLTFVNSIINFSLNDLSNSKILFSSFVTNLRRNHLY